ncbi:MAG: ribosome small subunit-dependent GTPase A [Candidatus Pacebacteria bacterium]|nr:ribosome small subunit-dependent GTPase A [Candidatus Paceibacterota bacterium]
MAYEFKIEDLGYDDYFQYEKDKLCLNGLGVARVVAEHKGSYDVISKNGSFSAKVTGKQMFNASSREDYPAVGDWVLVDEIEKGLAIIHGILPRRTLIRRRYGNKDKAGNKVDIQVIGANIDVAFIVESVDRDYSLNRFERYFAITVNQGIVPVIIFNKIDLVSRTELEEIMSETRKRFDGIDIILTSTFDDDGLEELRSFIKKGKTYCFLGSSGVGKSSLINELIQKETIETGDISEYSGRGKHTTTRREMYVLNSGGIVIDNPGIREVGVSGDKIGNTFNDISDLEKGCKFNDCTHTYEPGCQVLKALSDSTLGREEYENYLALKKESEYHTMSDLEKKEKDRSFGRYVKKVKKDIEKYNN